MTEQNNTNNSNNENVQPQAAPQPIIINNVTAQPDYSGKKKAPGSLRCAYTASSPAASTSSTGSSRC